MPDPDDRPTTGRSPRPHPPSVERVLAAARPETADRDPAAVLAMARAVVDEERARLARLPIREQRPAIRTTWAARSRRASRRSSTPSARRA